MMPFTRSELIDLVCRWLEPKRVPQRFRVYTDTSDFYRVDYDDIVILDDRPYLIRNNEREGRFGIDEQQKFWVKRAIDLLDGSRKIIKLVFHERFTAHVGPLSFECARSPGKEARILELVSSHKHFMHGFSAKDASGNLVRVINYIYGKRLPDFISGLSLDHEKYFRSLFPDILRNYITAVESILFLHEHREMHGDIRRDHILIDRETKEYRWIDFDFTHSNIENRYGYDLFGLGNILIYLTGGGDITVQDLEKNRPDIFSHIRAADVNIIFHNRIANLKKVLPHIPEELSYILLHFSRGAEVFYDDTRQFLDDLKKVEKALVIH